MNAPFLNIGKIADALHPAGSVLRAMALLEAFFDETGTHTDSPVTAIGGFVGSKDSWTALTPKWSGVLAQFEDKGVRWFHTAEALAQQGQFDRIDKPRLNYIVTQLAKALGELPLTPMFSAVVMEDWNEVVTDAEFLKRFPHPIDLCFENIVQTLWRWAKHHGDGEPVVPMFAYHQEFSPRMADIGRVYGSRDWYREILGPLAFGFPQQVIPLQAADLIAHQMNWDVQRRVYEPVNIYTGGPTKALDWATGGRYVHGNYFERSGLLLTIKRFKETGSI